MSLRSAYREQLLATATSASTVARIFQLPKACSPNMDISKIDLLIRASVDGPLTDELVEPMLGSLTREEFCDLFSKRVAHEFAADRLTFEIGDAAMNRLYSFAGRSSGGNIPSYTWDVFLAFDAGEYFRREDPEDVDPVEKYTRPDVLEIVARDNAGADTLTCQSSGKR